MNLFDEIDALPYTHRVAIATYILKTDRPSIAQLARAGGVCDGSIRAYLSIRPSRGKRLKADGKKRKNVVSP